MSRLGLSPICPLLSSSEQSEEEGGKRKTKKRKKVAEGQGDGSSSDEGSDSSSSSSESERTSETEEEQVEPASWRKKTVRALGPERGSGLLGQSLSHVLGQAQSSPRHLEQTMVSPIQPTTGQVLSSHTCIPFFSFSLPVAKVPR